MNYLIGYDLFWIFFTYAFLGWVLETSVAIFKKKRFVNRGFLNGPVCSAYGVAAVFMRIFFTELGQNWFFLFLGCGLLATVIEWNAGQLLKKLGYGKWWDYSNKKWNIDGYICLQYSILWGVLGAIATGWCNKYLLRFVHVIPKTPGNIALIVLLIILIVDGIGSYLVLLHISYKMPRIAAMNEEIDSITKKLELRIFRYLEKRLQKAYPQASRHNRTKEEATVFAKGCSFDKLILLFFIGSFLGAMFEMVFCRLKMGVWMSRSSLVWGQFSVIWGFAMMFATMILYNSRDKSDSFIFLFGTFLGGAYEYCCSVLGELVFHTVFWDYSKIPFNLGGRINLLYCFFWGIAAVVWMKQLYPFLSKWIEKIPKKIGKFLVNGVILFMVVDMIVSAAALMRYSKRSEDPKADTYIEQWLDQHFDDKRMKRVYPKAKQV